MIISKAAPERALVLVANADQRDQACARLSRDGYEVLGFADCENAVAWLEEETPTIAVIDGDLMPGCSGVLNVLGERGVLLVQTWEQTRRASYAAQLMGCSRQTIAARRTVDLSRVVAAFCGGELQLDPGEFHQLSQPAEPRLGVELSDFLYRGAA